MRKTQYDTNKIFPERWSPRAMSGEKVSKEDLMSLFEAARWAPSAFNEQPWRFMYVENGTEGWKKLFDLLSDFNKSWVKNASHLILIVSRKFSTHNEQSLSTHSFDTGAAWQNLALQGSMKKLVVHAMSGFDYEMVRQIFQITDKYKIEAMIAVGIPGDKETLPEHLQEREIPSDRKKIEEFVFEGSFLGLK